MMGALGQVGWSLVDAAATAVAVSRAAPGGGQEEVSKLPTIK